MVKIWSVVTVLAASALLAGCGGGGSASTEAPAAPRAAPELTKPCTLLSNDTVSKVFSIKKIASAEKPPVNTPNGRANYVCEYRAQNGPLGTLLVTVTDSTVSPAQVAKAWQKLPAAQPVPGVGDAAIYSVDQAKRVAMLAAAKPAQGKTVAMIFTGSPKITQEMLSTLVKEAIGSV
ncbi:hypothetical protein GCM10023321_34440 [Pseudonocardia eucalypti]|uniref:DUF2020 domain-containing protein n=1 Tax=Pseudonocardia eucalypti TaxID=648755 RepID=A0ABP9Q569_9PSEU|nr:hypothetical protein [Pseudonocardia eucalypti]